MKKNKNNAYENTKAKSTKRTKKIEIYPNNKHLFQAHSRKCLGIIFNNRQTFREHKLHG